MFMGASRQPEKIRLRPMELRDADAVYCRWINDPTIHRYLSTRTATVAGLRKYIHDMQDRGARFSAICLPSGRRIGTVKVEFDGLHGTVGIMIGDKRAWGKGYATAVLKRVVRLGRRWGLQSLRAGMMPGNLRSAAAFSRAGFIVQKQPNGFWKAVVRYAVR